LRDDSHVSVEAKSVEGVDANAPTLACLSFGSKGFDELGPCVFLHVRCDRVFEIADENVAAETDHLGHSVLIDGGNIHR